MFVDDLLSAIPRQEKKTRHFIASSIESVYLLIGYPGSIKNTTLPPTMSWDKMADRAVGPIRDSLGVQFLNRHLEITVEDYKVERLLELLNSAWLGDIKGFTALQAAVLIGNIYAVTLTCAWLNWSCHHLIGAMKRQIRKNYESIQQRRPVHTKDFAELFAEEDEQWLDPPFKRFARKICHNESILKEVWRLKDKHWISKNIKEELLYMRTQCLQHINKVHRWVRPISHFIKREHDGKIRQDASTDWGMGGGSGTLTYWWQLSWMDLHPELINRIHLHKKDKNKLWINELELAAIVVNLFAASAAINAGHLNVNWQPMLHCGGDNTSANTWAKKFSNSNKYARALTKLLAMGQKYLGIDIDVEHVPGKLNGFADAVSRGRPSKTLNTILKKEYPTNDDVLSCLQVDSSVTKIVLHRFDPSPLLKSHISNSLLGRDTSLLEELNKSNSGRLVRGHDITFDFAVNSWKWTLDSRS